MKLFPTAALAITSILMLTSTALAGGSLTNYQYITQFEAPPLTGSLANYVIVRFDAALTGSPSCAAGNTDKLIFDATSAAGQFRLHLLQAAMLAHRPVKATGTGACASDGIELLYWSAYQ